MSDHLYCSECDEECGITKISDEPYPEIVINLYLSDCCKEEIVDFLGRPFSTTPLRLAYSLQQSYLIDNNENS